MGGEDKWPSRLVNQMLNELDFGERSLSEHFCVLLRRYIHAPFMQVGISASLLLKTDLREMISREKLHQMGRQLWTTRFSIWRTAASSLGEVGGWRTNPEIAPPSHRLPYSTDQKLGPRCWEPSSLRPVAARQGSVDGMRAGLSSWTKGVTGGADPDTAKGREEAVESGNSSGSRSSRREAEEREEAVEKEGGTGGSPESIHGLWNSAENQESDLKAGLGNGRGESGAAAPPDSMKKDTSSSSVGRSKRHDLAILYTCTVCDTRSGQTMSRATYDTGVVIIRCPNCKNLHLIADRLGWFGEPGSVEDFLAAQGVSVRKGTEKSYEFTTEDLEGWTQSAN